MNELILAGATTLMKQIVATKGECVPAIIEDVRETLLFTRTKSNMLREACKGIENIEGAGEMKEALVEQKDEAWLAAEYMTKRLGDITRELKGPGSGNIGAPELLKVSQLKQGGVTIQAASDAERISDNEWAIEEEFEEKKAKGREPSHSGVLNRIRDKEAAKAVDRKKTKRETREVNERPRFVADYFDAMKVFTAELELAIAGAKRDKFDPASVNFLRTKHDNVRALMAQLEGMV